MLQRALQLSKFVLQNLISTSFNGDGAMRTKVLSFAVLVVALAAGGAAFAFNGFAFNGSDATPAVAATEVAGCCATGDCCCPGQGSCCDLTKQATGDSAKGLKKAVSCCSTGDCCCPGAGSCCAASNATVPACCKK